MTVVVEQRSQWCETAVMVYWMNLSNLPAWILDRGPRREDSECAVKADKTVGVKERTCRVGRSVWKVGGSVKNIPWACGMEG